jgi:hypothetical protein
LETVSGVSNNCTVHMANVWSLQQNIEKYITRSGKTLTVCLWSRIMFYYFHLLLSVTYITIYYTEQNCSISVAKFCEI